MENLELKKEIDKVLNENVAFTAIQNYMHTISIEKDNVAVIIKYTNKEFKISAEKFETVYGSYFRINLTENRDGFEKIINPERIITPEKELVKNISIAHKLYVLPIGNIYSSVKEKYEFQSLFGNLSAE